MLLLKLIKYAFLSELLKYIIISSLIDIFMIILHSNNIFFPLADIQYTQFLYMLFLKYALSLQVIGKIDNDFVENR